jgi:hypothetical protein
MEIIFLKILQVIIVLICSWPIFYIRGGLTSHTADTWASSSSEKVVKTIKIKQILT